MKKNYIAVFQKAENFIYTIFLIILTLFSTVIPSQAQSYQVASNNQSGISTQKGPFDIHELPGNFDALPPVITYTALTSTCSLGSRVLTATITDADGVPTSGIGAPRLYWQVNSGATQVAIGNFIGSNQYTFTFGLGATAGSLVTYYIVAQDNVGNVIAKPSGGAGGYTTNPPAAGTEPTTPDFYVVQSTLAAGTYTVGAGGSYSYLTITDAVNAYNNSCLSGAVIFLLMDATYDVSEVFPITINNPLASAANTLTIKPNTGINPLIQGTANDAIFKLSGADYVTIDGSNVTAGTTRNLTITNNSTNLSSVVVWLGSFSASNGATRNTIKNCTISGNASTTTYAGIVSSSGVIAGNVAETANTDNSFVNNAVNTCYNGIMLVGPTTGETNNVVSGNVVGSTLSTKKLGYRGVYISNETNVQVSGNTVSGIVSSIGMGSDVEPTAGVVVAGAISGGAIASNIINSISNTSVGGWPSYGISMQSTSAAAGIKVYNNMINGTIAYGNTSIPGNNGIGIALIAGGGYGIYFNSVHLQTNQSSAGGGISSCIFIGPGITGSASVDVRNNIFSDRRSSGTSYAIYCSQPNIIFSNINYNDYYATSFLGFLGVNRANIAAWQTATAFDGNSVAVNPIFVNPVSPGTDLHLQLISPLNDQGTPISGITTDIDGNTRSVTVPDIGADEFTPPACSGNSGGTATADFITVCSSGAVSLSASGFSYGLGIAYQWELSTVSATGPWSTTGLTTETNPTSANPPAISVTTWYRLRVRCSAGTPGYSNVVQVTVYNPAILSSTPASRCGPGFVTLAATGMATTAIQWYTAATGGIPVFTGSPFTTPTSISTTTTYYAESTYLGSSGSVGLNNPNSAGGISTQLISWQVYFNVIQATKLLTVDIYPAVAGENFTLEVYNSTGTVLLSRNFTTLVSGGATVQTLDLGVALPIGNGYYLYAPAGIPPTGLTRNLSGVTYPYNSTDIVITGNEFSPSYYMCYYNWRFTNGCSSSPRTAVVATVSPSATVNVSATPASICAGSSTVINATSTNTGFTYTWTAPSMTGAMQTVTPATTTTYTVNATDGVCTGTNTVTVTVNPSSTAVDIAPATVTRCAGAPAQLLTATGGDIAGSIIIGQDFNAGTPGTSANPAGGWVIANTSTGGTVANAAWTYRGDGYIYPGYTFHSNDSTTFFMTNSDAQGGSSSARTRTVLQSPAFSCVGYTSISLYFYHCFTAFGAPVDSVTVEYSNNNSTWSTLRSFPAGRGTTVKFRKDTISLNAYLGVATNYIRFRYYAAQAFFWTIDNITVVGSNSGSTPITWSPSAGLFTNPGATIAYTGTATNTVYANPTVSTTYTATATPVNACERTQTIDVVVRPVSGNMTGSTAVCPSGSATISVDLTGTGPWNITYTDGVTPVTVNNIPASPYTFVVNPLVTTTYSLTAVSDFYCTAPASNVTGTATITVSATLFSTWIGLSSDWTDPANWCGGVPTSTKDVAIPVTAFNPIITVTTAVSRDISIASGASLIINSGGIFSFKGAFVNNGTIVNNGSIILNGTTAQSFPGGTTGTITSMNLLEVNNPAGVTFNKEFTIWGTLKPTAGIISLNDTITLHSDTTSTARVSALGATAGFTYNAPGKFTVERFISSASRTAWRLLAAPISGAQTINQAWQEGQLPAVYSSTGYGMQIVGPSAAGTGFDLNNAFPSVKKYAQATNSWVTIPGTNGPIASTDGYMAFVRGDRGSNTFGAMSRTTLRMSGPIKTGNVGPISTAIPSGFICVGNPYPSAIDFTTTTRNGLQNTYYLWDPKLGTYGGYQTFSFPGYTATPGLGSYVNGNKFIESGQAFFVVATAAGGPHDISFSESNKVAGSYPTQRLDGQEKQLSTRLYAASASNTNLIDGTLAEFDASFSNVIDDLDAPKLTNFGENIGILTAGKSISVERRGEIINTDTIFYQLGQLRQQGYQLEFSAKNLANQGLTAWLVDNYLHSNRMIDLNVVSIIDFDVNPDAGSAASNRFMLVFRQLAPVPVTFTNIAAWRLEKDIMVKWKVENELNIDHYEVERSSEGRSFSKIGSQPATGNGGGSSEEYNWLDKSPFAGNNFYRIKSVGIGNDIKYSEVVKVNMDGDPSLITVYPNPVKNDYIGLSFNDQPKGYYDVKLFGTNGQLILKRGINHPGGSQRITVPVSSSLAAGVYNLEIILPAKKKRIFRVVIE